MSTPLLTGPAGQADSIGVALRPRARATAEWAAAADRSLAGASPAEIFA